MVYLRLLQFWRALPAAGVGTKLAPPIAKASFEGCTTSPKIGPAGGDRKTEETDFEYTLSDRWPAAKWNDLSDDADQFSSKGSLRR